MVLLGQKDHAILLGPLFCGVLNLNSLLELNKKDQAFLPGLLSFGPEGSELNRVLEPVE